VRYTRGAWTGEVLATVGRTTFAVVTAGGVVERTLSRDFLISAAALADLGEPQRGDRIFEADDQRRWTHEVLAPAGEPPWRWADPIRACYRIHTKCIRTEPL
jgi:hypothetical protein